MSIYCNRGFIMVMRAYPEQYFSVNMPTPTTAPTNTPTNPQVIYVQNNEDIQRWILFGAALAVVCILIGAALMYYAKK